MPRQGERGQPSIKGWHDCGLSRFPGETPPDIHPVVNRAWEVATDPYDGGTYLGMVTRENDTYESLSQALTSPIQGGVCYTFSAFLMRSDQYKSATSKTVELGTGEKENFVRPSVFLIWGGNYFCDKAELLGESPAVSNNTWKKYKFLFQPQRTHKYITIEAFYKTPILEAYNGHVLVDGLSEIAPVECPLFPQNLIAEVSDPPVRTETISGSSGGTISSGKSSSSGKSGTIKQGTVSSPPKTFTPVLITELVPGKILLTKSGFLTIYTFNTDSVNVDRFIRSWTN